MGKSKTTGKGRLDRFYYLAKEQGFRSRAAFKLVQLDRKYRFLASARSLLDLCAAPGGWMQVATKNMPVGSLIVGVDLVPIRPIRGAVSLQEDITTPKCRASLKKVLKEKGYSLVNVVLHDGSPNVGGAWSKEASSQAALVLDALKLATEFLSPGGTFVTKVFRSQDYSSLLYALKQLFRKVEVTKPVASRATSAEIYVIGLEYNAPAKIDPRLLDAKHLFQDIVEPAKVVDVLAPSKRKRHREGYEEGNTTLRKECTATEFVWCDKPLDLLGTVTAISFKDTGCSVIKEHPLTKEEILICCEDLHVLGKQEFKQLLKWRLQIRKALAHPAGGEDAKTESKDPDAEEEGVLAQMEELKGLMERKKKRQKKLLSKRKAKAKTRSATGMQVDVMEDAYREDDLFSLAAIKGKKDLHTVEDIESADDDEGYDSEDKILNGVQQDAEDSDLDSEEERQRYDAELDEYLEHAYDKFRATKDGSTKRRQRAKLADLEKDSELWKEDVGGSDAQESHDAGSGSDQEDEDGNPLVVPLVSKVKPSKEQLAQQWFSQDVFAGVDTANDISDDEMEGGEKHTEKNLELEEVIRAEQKGVDRQKKRGQTSASADADDGDFEIVPAEASASSDDSSTDDDADYDSDEKAEILAYAKHMLRKKSAEDILDAAYNRYTFNDDNLPRWFADDERKHSQPQKPVTKEEVEAMKAQFRDINARPVKKVAEAKARKKRRVQKKLEQVRQKATAIADQTDLTPKSKNSMMDKLYKKALAAPKKPKREIVVAKKGVGTKGGKGRVVVDRRMKKDARSRGNGPVKAGFKRKGVKVGAGKGRGKAGAGASFAGAGKAGARSKAGGKGRGSGRPQSGRK